MTAPDSLAAWITSSRRGIQPQPRACSPGACPPARARHDLAKKRGFAMERVARLANGNRLGESESWGQTGWLGASHAPDPPEAGHGLSSVAAS